MVREFKRVAVCLAEEVCPATVSLTRWQPETKKGRGSLPSAGPMPELGLQAAPRPCGSEQKERRLLEETKIQR